MISSEMPIYDYRCDHCGHVFSAVQSYAEGPLAACPNCGKTPRRLLSTAAIVFKGSGWYKTDSRPAPKEEGSSSGAKPADTAKTDAKPDAKPAKKPAEKPPAPKGEAAS